MRFSLRLFVTNVFIIIVIGIDDGTHGQNGKKSRFFFSVTATGKIDEKFVASFKKKLVVAGHRFKLLVAPTLFGSC